MALQDYFADALAKEFGSGIDINFADPAASRILMPGARAETMFDIYSAANLSVTSAPNFLPTEKDAFKLHTANTLPFAFDLQGNRIGIRPEGAATNLVKQSKGLTDATLTGATTSAFGHFGPDGQPFSLSALAENTDNSEHRATWTFPLTAGANQKLAVAFFVRRAERRIVRLSMADNTGVTGYVELDMDTGALTVTGALEPIVIHVGGGLWWLSGCLPADAAAVSVNVMLKMCQSAGVTSYAGTGGVRIFAGFVQAEIVTGSLFRAASWIETAAASVTRAGDLIRVPATLMQSMANNALGATLYAEFYPESGSHFVLQLNDNVVPSAAHHITCSAWYTGITLSGASRDVTMANTYITGGTLALNAQGRLVKVAYRTTHGRRRLVSSLAPNAPYDDSGLYSLPAIGGPNCGALQIGGTNVGTGARCVIRRATYWNGGLSDAALLSLVS